MTERPLVERLEAAGRDERLSTGALYLEAAMALAVTEAELAQSTTALTLAHAEIKGHMKIKDDLQARVAELERVIRESRMPHGLCKIEGSCTACTAQQALDEIAALKDRA